MKYQLLLGDCLEIMPTLESGSVDAIIADWPYGTTACKWDSIIPLDKLWPECKRVIRRNGAIVLFSCQPFTSVLVVSNIETFKYRWVWKKDRPTGHLNSKRMPLRYDEEICVFYEEQCTYNPQMTNGHKPRNKNGRTANPSGVWGKFTRQVDGGQTTRFPSTVLPFDTHNSAHGILHPTQKPVALLEYLIKTYTNPGDLVLDNTFGSCTTGEACLRTNRRFIGIEKDAGYYQIGVDRMKRVEAELRGDLNHLPMFAEATV